MAVKMSNNATSLLAGNINATDTTLSVQSGDAGLFPSLVTGEWFPVTVVDNAGNMEVMKATARAGAIITVERGQEGTTAIAFQAGARVDLRATAAAMSDLGDFTTTDTVTAALNGAQVYDPLGNGDQLVGLKSDNVSFRTTWGNIKNLLTSLYDAKYLSLFGGALLGNLEFIRNIPTIIFKSPTGVNQWSIRANISDTVNAGVQVVWSGLAIGDFRNDGTFTAFNHVYAGIDRNAYLAPDGAIYGSAWSAWGSLFAMSAIENRINGLITQRAVTETRITGLLAGSFYLPSGTSGGIGSSGWMVANLTKPDGGTLGYELRAPQVLINGSWRSLGGW